MYRLWRRKCPLLTRSLLPQNREIFRQWANNRFLALWGTCALAGATYAASESKNTEEWRATSEHPSRKSYKYLICGGGVAAQAALKVFVQRGEVDDLVLISPELRGANAESVPAENEADEKDDVGILSRLYSSFPSTFQSWPGYQRQYPEVVIGPKVTKLDAVNRVATLDDGAQISFERCLIAVGTNVPDIPFGRVVSTEAKTLVSGAQSTSEWRHINETIQSKFVPAISGKHDGCRAHVTIVGGGWMSPVIGALLLEKGADVTFVYSEPSFLSRYLPKYVAKDILDRFHYQSYGGVNTLAYSSIRYIVARKPLSATKDSTPGIREAEVYLGTVFDAFSIVDFRTDHVLFAPTLSSNVPLEVSLTKDNGGLIANPELAIASDIYIAGSAVSVASGGIEYPRGLRWSSDHARTTGTHAALNMLGGREAYEHVPILSVDLSLVNLKVHVLGDLDGSMETFGYFLRTKARQDDTCGGSLEKGVVFYVKPAPLRHRGAAQQLRIAGIALWEGSKINGLEDLQQLKERAGLFLSSEPISRPEMEIRMDHFARENLGISLFNQQVAERIDSVSLNPKESTSDLELDTESPASFELESAHSDSISQETNESQPIAKVHPESPADFERKEKTGLKPVPEVEQVGNGDSRTKHPSQNVLWRRHRPAGSVRIEPDETLWVKNETIGAASPGSRADKVSKAYEDLLRRSAGKV